MKPTYPSLLTTALLPALIHAVAFLPTQPSSVSYSLNSTATYITSMPSSPTSSSNLSFIPGLIGPSLSILTISPTSTSPANITAYCTQQCNNALSACYAVCFTPECPDAPCNPAHCQDDCDEWFGVISECVKSCVLDPGILVTYPFPSATGVVAVSQDG